MQHNFIMLLMSPSSIDIFFHLFVVVGLCCLFGGSFGPVLSLLFFLFRWFWGAASVYLPYRVEWDDGRLYRGLMLLH